MVMNINCLKVLISFFLGAAIAGACILFYLTANPLRRQEELHPWRNEIKVAYSKEKMEEQALAQVLRRAAMDDNTLIMATLYQAWPTPSSILDLFLESFRIGEVTQHLLQHLLIVAMDPKAFDMCRAMHEHCYFLETEGVNFAAEKRLMSKYYHKMRWKRLRFQRIVLELGYNFIFTDLDIMWLRNPFKFFSPKVHLITSCDFFNGNPADLHNVPNGGFLYVKSCEQTIELYKYWYFAAKQYPGSNDQDVLNKIKNEGYVAWLQLDIQFLDTAYFGGFCQPSKDLNKVYTMHANCCGGVESVDNKLHDLRVLLDDWKKYLEGKETERISWRVPDKCQSNATTS